VYVRSVGVCYPELCLQEFGTITVLFLWVDAVFWERDASILKV